MTDIYCLGFYPPHENNSLHINPDQKVLEGIHKNGKQFNPGFNQLLTIAKEASIPLILELHPDTFELARGKYDEQGQEIIDWAKAHDITLIQELNHHFIKEDYRDRIHLNEKGQRKVAKLMKSVIWRWQRKQ